MLPLRYVPIPFEPPGGFEVAMLRALRQPFAVAFDSAVQGELGRESCFSFAPSMLLQCTGRSATFQRGRHASRLEGDPLEVFERVERFTQQECPLLGPLHTPGFTGGWAGLLGFDLRCYIEDLPPPKPLGPQFPDLQAGFYPWTVAFNHATGACELRLLHGAPGGPEDIGELAQRLHELLAREHSSSLTTFSAPELHTTRDDFMAQVARVKHHIREGDIYQANLTRMVAREATCEPVQLYASLRAANPAPFAGFLDCGHGRAILSSSPERFVSVRDGVCETRPIKGTRPRGADAEQDARLKAELAASEKDRAELTMIVDLERNDLSKVCVPGTVKVPSLLHVHSYARVHHLESTVVGELREGVAPVELIRATFPGGSISGAPKKRALQIIHDLEPVRRGPYTGSLFWLRPDGDFESNILIRTLLCEPGRVSYHVGGGIVADSEPEAEWAETLAKADGLERAMAGAP